MTIKELLDKQKELDNIIENNCSNAEIYSKEFINENLLALIVEIAEFQNEHEKAARLTEYVDILHFMLSIGNSLKIKSIIINKELCEFYSQLCFNVIDTLTYYVECCKLANSIKSFKYWSKQDICTSNLTTAWIDLFISFLNLGYAENYTSIQIEKAYLEKYNINLTRQTEGY